jgi:hypothetical protein
VRGAGQVNLVARWSGGAFRQDLGASLTVDGSEVLTDGNTGVTAFSAGGLAGGVVGLFMSDGNENQSSDLGLYFSAPFLAFTDVFVDTAKPELIDFTFTPGSEDDSIISQKLKASNWPSDGAQVLVFFQ